jgi:hypothetical protein
MEPDKTLTLETFMDEDDVVLAVKDQGSGIPEDIIVQDRLRDQYGGDQVLCSLLHRGWTNGKNGHKAVVLKKDHGPQLNRH